MAHRAVKTFDDIMNKEMVIGAQAPGSTQYDYPMLANALFSMKFKVITGYESTPKIHLAMERGEVHGTVAKLVDAAGRSMPTGSRTRRSSVFAQWALKKHPGPARRADGARPREDRRRPAGAPASRSRGSNSAGPFFMPPGVPADRVQALRRAFDATMKDKEFLADAEKLKIEIDPLTGEQVAELIARSRTPRRRSPTRVRKAMEPRGR